MYVRFLVYCAGTLYLDLTRDSGPTFRDAMSHVPELKLLHILLNESKDRSTDVHVRIGASMI